MKAVIIAALICVPSLSAAQSKPYHDEISKIFRGSWAANLADCRDIDGVNKVVIDGGSVNYYEGNDYLLVGVEFGGTMTKGGGSGSLFNGRFTGRTETNLLGESNIRLEIDDSNKDVMYRYPIGDDGDPIAAREVRSIRCSTK
jgi:hypothetical protein